MQKLVNNFGDCSPTHKSMRLKVLLIFPVLLFTYSLNFAQTAAFQMLSSSDSSSEDAFGNSIDLYEDYLVVGTRRADGMISSGAVYVYERDDNGIWSMSKK